MWQCACMLKSLQLCPTLCNPMDCSPPGSSVHGILWARILEWVAMPLLQGIFPTQGLNPRLLWPLHCTWILYCWATGKVPTYGCVCDIYALYICIFFYPSLVCFCILTIVNNAALKKPGSINAANLKHESKTWVSQLTGLCFMAKSCPVVHFFSLLKNTYHWQFNAVLIVRAKYCQQPKDPTTGNKMLKWNILQDLLFKKKLVKKPTYFIVSGRMPKTLVTMVASK